MKLSVKKLFQSLRNSFKGIRYALGQQNFFLMIFIAAAVIILGVILRLHYFEWLIVILTIGVVLSLEVFNTALETTMDFLEPNLSDKIKVLKNLAAGATVLICLIAIIIGLMIFLPKIIILL